MKILWAFTPFDQNENLHKIGKKIITTLFNKKDSYEVIYVASNAEAELATAFNIPVKDRYLNYPKKLIQAQLKKLSIKKMKVNILSENSISLTATVKKVVTYSKENKTSLIIIATNSKKFLPRAILGSFAETLVHLSVCDLLIFHQKTKLNSKAVENIIYAHDFSPKGTKGLEKVIVYVKKWNSLLTVVHVPIPEIGMELHEFKVNTDKKVLKLENYLKKHKVRYVITLEYKISPISETLISIAGKSKGSIIALTAQTNQLAALLGGSVTRQVLRESILPTLVLKV